MINIVANDRFIADSSLVAHKDATVPLHLPTVILQCMTVNVIKRHEKSDATYLCMKDMMAL